MPNEKLVEVEALTQLHIPGEKTKKIGEKLKLPESTVDILTAGENPSVKRIKVEKVATTVVHKTTIGENK